MNSPSNRPPSPKKKLKLQKTALKKLSDAEATQVVGGGSGINSACRLTNDY